MALSLILPLAREALWLTLLLSLPVVLAASLVGILVSLFQALTQVQDQTLPFLIKLLAACLTLALCARWMGNLLIAYVEKCFALIGRMG